MDRADEFAAFYAGAFARLVGMPVHEVAATLRVPTGTVKTRLARGRRALAARLTERGSEEVRSHR